MEKTTRISLRCKRMSKPTKPIYRPSSKELEAGEDDVATPLRASQLEPNEALRRCDAFGNISDIIYSCIHYMQDFNVTSIISICLYPDIYIYIWSRPPAGYPPPPHGMVQVGVLGPGTWHAFTAPSLGYVPSRFAFVPALSRVPCKYHRILHHLQRLRLHQPALPPIHNHPTHSHRGRGREP